MSSRVDLTKIPQDKVNRLLDRIDSADDAALASKRAEPWRPYRVYPVKVVATEPGGTTRTLQVITRNLSGGGMAFVAQGFLHQGTKCKLDLTTVENAWQTVTGAVRRCVHLGGAMHEIGIEFEEPIDPSRFVPVKVTARILIAEDNPAVSRMTELILTRAEATVEIVCNGQEAVRAATESLFDLILMDVEMPVMNGLDATRALRDRGVTIPIIAFTGRDGEAERQECLDAGCTDHLPKPVQRHELLQHVLRHLSQVTAITSTLADDPEMEEVIAALVENLPTVLRDCQKLHETGDHANLLRHVRDVKSSCGTHGFGQIAEAARQVEQVLLAARDGTATGNLRGALRTDGSMDSSTTDAALSRTMDELLALASRARAGTQG